MTIPRTLGLNSVSVVITAQSHNPSILTKEFVVSRGIVPEDWTLREAVAIPPLSLLRYDNGIQWIVDQSRLNVIEDCKGEFQDNYLVHDMVDKYLGIVTHAPYRSLGLNWVVSIEQERPSSWLLEKFLRKNLWVPGGPDLIGMEPKFAFQVGDTVLNIALGVPQNSHTVLADCNVHHQGPLDATELRRAINLWRDHQSRIVQVLHMMLSGDAET